MTTQTTGGYVVSERDLAMQPVPGAKATVRVPIDRSVGCQHLIQRVYQYALGRSPLMHTGDSEDLLFVVSGHGSLRINDATHALEPLLGAFVPPHSAYQIDNPHAEPLLIVSVLTPQPGYAPAHQADAALRADGVLTVREAEQEPLPAGNRTFKYMVNTRLGCRNATQFIGFIPTSKAPFHTHPYEEVIYIIDGEGIIHVGEASLPVRAGSSIYLPPQLRHCIENPNAQPIRLLGVFCPAGDPGSKASEDQA
jgi:mannose-6-phosphate isomerase-like protein (cupin superfamily)